MDRLQILYSLLDENITELELIGVASSLVGHEIVLLSEDILGISGYCVQLLDGYVLGVNCHLTPLGRANTIGHELAHILLGHAPACNFELRDWRQRRDISLTKRRLGSYENEVEEYSAESAGRMISRFLYRSGKQVPVALRRRK